MYGPATYGAHAFSSSNMKNGTALYQRARSKGRMSAFMRLLTRKENALFSLAALLQGKKVRAQRYAGRETVRIDQIVGSEGRTEDFNRRFFPLSERNRDRWLSVLSARMHRVPLPPVSLIRVGDQYVVRDGHHRISVARALGEVFVEAEVTVFETAS